MSHSGYIDWHRISRHGTDTRQGSTVVFAYWLVDYTTNIADDGVTVLKHEGEHPDWFLHADHADQLVFSVGVDELIPSPNVGEVYDTHLTSRPLLATVCLGTAAATYQAPDGDYWWCALGDLTRAGRRVVKELSMLYLRSPVIVTFMDWRPMKTAVPGADQGSATVTAAPGHNDLTAVIDAIRPDQTMVLDPDRTMVMRAVPKE